MSEIERRPSDDAGIDIFRPAGPPAPAGRYQRYVDVREQYPAVVRRDARRDRENESRHVVDMRQLKRQADELVGRAIAGAYVETETVKALRTRNTEVKYQLLRARKESQVLASDDLELAAKFAEIDDDLYQSARLVGRGR